MDSKKNQISINTFRNLSTFLLFCSSYTSQIHKLPESFRCRIQQKSEWPKFTGIVSRGGWVNDWIWNARYYCFFLLVYQLCMKFVEEVKKLKKKLRSFWQRKGKNLACIVLIVWDSGVFRCTSHQLIYQSSYTSLVALDSRESMHFFTKFCDGCSANEWKIVAEK